MLRRRGRCRRRRSGSCCTAPPFGRVVRAGVQNPDMVGALGISLQPYMTAVAALGIGLAGLAGVLLAPIYARASGDGPGDHHAAFVVVVIGGLGSFWGVVAAALLVGVVRGLTVYFLSAGRRSVDLSADGCWFCCSGRAACSANASSGSSERRCMPKRFHPLLIAAAAALLVLPFVLLAARPDADDRRPTSSSSPSPAWRSTSWSAIPASSRSAMAPGSGLPPMRPRCCSATGFPDRLSCPRYLGDPCSSRLSPLLGLSDPAAARRLFLAADAGAFRHAVRHRVSLDRGHRRRKRPRRRHAPDVLGRRSRERTDLLLARRADRASASSILLWRFHRSPVGHVLVAIRENEQRARFIGYPTDRYKLFAFTISAAITGARRRAVGLQSSLASAEPISVPFSGELLAMVVIGGMRSFLGPGARRAVLHPVSRIPVDLDPKLAALLRPPVRRLHRVLADRPRRRRRAAASRRSARRSVEAAAMAARAIDRMCRCPRSFVRTAAGGPVLIAREHAKSFGGIRAVARRHHRCAIARCTR